MRKKMLSFHPSRLKFILSVGGLCFIIWLILRTPNPFTVSLPKDGESPFGMDAFSYWLAQASSYRDNLTISGFAAWRYAPIWLPILWLPQHLTFILFAYLIAAVEFACLLYLTRSWVLGSFCFIFVGFEIFEGNIYLLSAALLIFILRHVSQKPYLAGLWSFFLLTKVTPFILVSWHLFRGEWRQLTWALGMGGLIIGLGLLLDRTTWLAWISSFMTTSTDVIQASPLGLTLPIRLGISLVLVAIGARSNRQIFLVPALFLAMPTIWWHTYSILIAFYAAARLDQGSPKTIARTNENLPAPAETSIIKA
jgi:hypothetical protein